ncbi:uncharacterized protein LOC114880560 isoform X2 [Osmia bicornis bicornis]|uniref:uncharacterized protein LOC114880560 isoform X2 n=1 Tax=Osmia bicornis bicornis TaxID=1437191 RepID=UPI0010F8A890|nr:uncharacterized protein LOC114880560 isoform X2 [Osmia bicornis bicornis]
MSDEIEMLEINKCILSKLWYTSLAIYQENIKCKYLLPQCNNDTVDFIEPRTLITNLIHSQSENEHQWIIYTLLQKLIDNATLDIKYIEKQQNYIQWLHALSLCKNLTTHLKQGLLMLLKNDSEQQCLEVFEKMHHEYFIFLKQNIHKNPTITCWILNELLLLYCNASTNIVYSLQDLYFSLMKELLELKLSKQQLISENSFGYVLCIISKMNIIEFDTDTLSRSLFPMLLKTCEIQDVESALYSRTSRTFFNKWCIFLNEIYAHSEAVNNLNDALKIQEVLFHSTSSFSTSFVNKNKLIERVANMKIHWVIDILDICYTLITNGKYDNVSSVLSCKLLKTCWPVLLFKVLNEYSQKEIPFNEVEENYDCIFNSINFLISKYDFDELYDPMLHELKVTLKKDITILEYILKWTKENSKIKDYNQLEEVTKSVDFQQKGSVKWVFNLLQYFSSLSVLKMTINIHEDDHNKIKNLLEYLCEPKNIFYAYCSILNALKAILLCDSYNTKHYAIAKHFSNMRHYVQTLYPLSLRIQVIENIFCLLFLQHEDFDHIQKTCDKNNINTFAEQSKFENKWIRQPSMGFVCNKYAVRDILFHLEDVISVTEMEYTNLKSENECTEEVDQIQKHISFIKEAITDAKWRLALYTNSQFTENIDIKEAENSCLAKSKIKILTDRKLISNRSKENILFYQENSIPDEIKVKSNSSSESEAVHNNTRWRKRSRHIPAAKEATTIKDITHKPSFVNCLLASKESLIIRCLWKNDYARAQDIIETSNIKNTQLNGEVEFSKALHMFKKNLYKQDNTLNDKNQSRENLQSSTLENLRLVTKEGIQSFRQTSQLETFLASQEINLRMLTMEVLNSNEVLTICALDVALTMSQIYPISYNLCEVAMKYLKLCKTFDNTEYAHFFFTFYQLLYENKEVSVENILCDAKIALSKKDCKEKDDFWNEIMVKHQEFKESQGNKNIINKILKDSNYLPGLKVLGKVATVSCGIKKYIQNVSSHLQLLHSIIPAEHAILTISDLLKIPLHYYFGYQIFELKVEPHKLEPITHSLQVNLTHSILTNIYPKFFYEKDINYATISKESGCIILNKALFKSDISYRIQGPNQCVSEILMELLQILHNLNIGHSHLSHDICRSISKHPDVQDVLKKTSRLVNLDLSELSVGDDTLTFLLNTWNLMYLHATLTIWANYPPFNSLQHIISLMSIGYLIGDLGLVTLAVLRSKLLDNMMLDNTFFVQVEELNEPAWQDLDITYNPAVVFMMANEFYGTPCIRVCNAESLNKDLIIAFHEYLDYYSLRSEKSIQNMETQTIMLLPEIMERYQKSISKSQRSDSHNGSNNDNLFSINDYYRSFDKHIVVQYMPSSYLYSILLKYSNCPIVHHQKQTNQYKTVWKTHIIRSSLLQYLESQSWVISYLLQRIQNENPTILENNCDHLKRIACLENLLSSSWIEEMKTLFENNQTLAAIFEIISIKRLWSHFESMLNENEWNACLKLINALPSHLALSTEVQYFKDKVISYIVSKKDSLLNVETLQCLYQIKDVYTLNQTVLYNINKWHIYVCEQALLHAVYHVDNDKLPVHCKFQLNEILNRVLIFHKMLPYCETKSNDSWYDIVYCTEKIDPLQIIKSLIDADKFELCLEWMECQAFSLEIHPSIREEFLIGLLKSESQNFKQTLKFLQTLPLDQSVKLCKIVLKKLESIDSLQFICNYLLQYCKATETIKYRRTLLGIDILSALEVQERPLYIHLIKKPLLMLEQLLMNCKFENIQKILNKIQDKLEQVDISRNNFDKIIRFYAKKSLDCRVSLQCDTSENKSRNVQYSASESENAEFVMPLLVPTKEEWVPNDKARKCSCCKNVIFSMFNRRHHCRRCGRVICATCSQHRMQVSGYPPSVLVRVCDDCKRQTVLQAHVLQGTSSTPSSEVFDYWRLTRDEKHNETIREEFSFEYAPNISLCLAILNLHSDHKTYTSFLLDCCDEMRRLLQPVSNGKVNPEVDHVVIIKMIRSLLIAAKVKCAKLGLNTGLTHCDRFLSQVDLIANLVQSDCLHLIPSDNLDEDEFRCTLRKLRDVLIEKEQWTLALDISTKAGLDTQGVWATWGKACLKMGYFDQARDKFFHCLDKVQFENFDDWVILSYPKDSETTTKGETQKSITKTNKTDKDGNIKMDESSLKKTEFSKNRPLKDPPLLTEILQIIDNLNVYKQYVHYPHQYKSSACQEILNNFGNYTMPSHRQSNLKNIFTIMQNVYYHESLYYLLTYGSYNSILEFFLKHEEFNKCLSFTLQNNLEADLFFNAVYLYCLRNGSVEKLQEAMINKDSSLLIWKKYLIHVCHSLEKKQYLNILYQLQLFMKDSIRAAMTCIRFYLSEISSYTDLCSRAHFLLDAQRHLESELQLDSLNRKRKKSTSSMHSNQGILTMEMDPSEVDKHINTICRQMEITKFLGNCEKEERAPLQFLHLFPGKDPNSSQVLELPTLFGSQQQKIDLAVLAILCGHNIDEGFGIAFRIIL